MSNVKLPAIKMYVSRQYLTQNVEDRYFFEEVYLLSVKAVHYRALQFTVYTEKGAIYSGLPIEAMFWGDESALFFTGDTELLQPYSCLEGPAELIIHDLLKHQHCIAHLNADMSVSGTYIFTIEYNAVNGLADDPEQFKTHNIIALDGGQLCAMPNNKIQFTDNYFAYDQTETLTIDYKRNKTRYYPGG